MKTVQLEDSAHALLKELSEHEGRSMPKQIKIMTQQAYKEADLTMKPRTLKSMGLPYLGDAKTIVLKPEGAKQ